MAEWNGLGEQLDLKPSCDSCAELHRRVEELEKRPPFKIVGSLDGMDELENEVWKLRTENARLREEVSFLFGLAPAWAKEPVLPDFNNPLWIGTGTPEGDIEIYNKVMGIKEELEECGE